MKLISAVILYAILAAVYAAENIYTNKYDNVDVDKILHNDRVLTNYIKCLMDEGPCTAEGRELKSKLIFFYVASEKKTIHIYIQVFYVQILTNLVSGKNRFLEIS